MHLVCQYSLFVIIQIVIRPLVTHSFQITNADLSMTVFSGAKNAVIRFTCSVNT